MSATLTGSRRASRSRPARSPWQMVVNDPLTSLSAMTTYSGTWTINTYAQCVVATTTQCRAFANVTLDSVAPAHIIECQVEIPSSGFSSSNSHLRMGFQNANTSGAYNGGIRGDGKAYLEQDATAAITTGAFDLTGLAGTWVTVRWMWDRSTALWTITIGGRVYLSYPDLVQSFTGSMAPYIVAYSNAAMTVRFRNLRVWSFQGTNAELAANQLLPQPYDADSR